MYGPPVPPPPQLYIKAVETEAGQAAQRQQHLSSAGSDERSGKDFWAVDVYHAGTAALIRNSPVVGIDSYNQKLKKNANGTVDVYFAPKPLEGQESNWVMTSKGKPFFMMFRFYGPEERAVDGELGAQRH